MSETGAALIAAERQRQIDVEGWTPEHDRQHGPVALESAAWSYYWYGEQPVPPPDWPWEAGWWKPKDRLRNLVRAGALMQAALDSGGPQRLADDRDRTAAEIDRLRAVTA